MLVGQTGPLILAAFLPQVCLNFGENDVIHHKAAGVLEEHGEVRVAQEWEQTLEISKQKLAAEKTERNRVERELLALAAELDSLRDTKERDFRLREEELKRRQEAEEKRLTEQRELAEAGSRENERLRRELEVLFYKEETARKAGEVFEERLAGAERDRDAAKERERKAQAEREEAERRERRQREEKEKAREAATQAADQVGRGRRPGGSGRRERRRIRQQAREAAAQTWRKIRYGHRLG